MQKKIPLKLIPDQYKFEYLQAHKKVYEINEKLRGFKIETEEQLEYVKKLLRDYYNSFTKIRHLNKSYQNF